MPTSGNNGTGASTNSNITISTSGTSGIIYSNSTGLSWINSNIPTSNRFAVESNFGIDEFDEFIQAVELPEFSIDPMDDTIVLSPLRIKILANEKFSTGDILHHLKKTYNFNIDILDAEGEVKESWTLTGKLIKYEMDELNYDSSDELGHYLAFEVDNYKIEEK